MTYQVTIKDEATYEFNASEYSKEGAVNEALNYFDERKPTITIKVVPGVPNSVPLWAVINPDGTFAGVPCVSEEEAREMACQKKGRRVFQMAYDENVQVW